MKILGIQRFFKNVSLFACEFRHKAFFKPFFEVFLHFIYFLCMTTVFEMEWFM